MLYVFLYFAKNRMNYFLRPPAAASRVMPIAAMMVVIPPGDFCVTPAAAGAGACAGAAEAGAGVCAGALVATVADDAIWWRQ